MYFVMYGGMDIEMCTEMIKNNPSTETLELVPPELITQEMCALVFKNDPSVEIFRLFPDCFIRQEMCDLVFENEPSRETLEYIPLKFMTQEMFNKMIEINPSENILDFFPNSFIIQFISDLQDEMIDMNKEEFEQRIKNFETQVKEILCLTCEFSISLKKAIEEVKNDYFKNN